MLAMSPSKHAKVSAVTDQDLDLVEIVADVVSAYVSNNAVTPSEIPGLIEAVHRALGRLGGPGPETTIEKRAPAVSIRKSVTADYLISLEDGRRFKALKRHLRTLGMTPDDYRRKWSLPQDYPMVAPAYAARRSELAKINRLGGRRRKSVEPLITTDHSAPGPVMPRPKRGRPKKAVAAE
jgi:predicted transcriptional regulator